MNTRAGKFVSVVNALGPLVIGAPSPQSGWPGLLTILVDGTPVNIALHVSAISHHHRAPYEYRFQNPADRSLVSDQHGLALPVLLGLGHPAAPHILVAVDGRTRVGRASRFSILFHERIVLEASQYGWAEYVGANGEKIFAFVPAFFPIFLAQINESGSISSEQIKEMAVAAGFFDPLNNAQSQAAAAVRATRGVTVLARKAGAGRRIREAYSHTCAMCGLGSNLLQGAHIYPVEAPGSTDDIWNGLSLCYNHHRAFDLHLIWVDPRNYQVHLHPSLHADAVFNSGTRNFVSGTWGRLAIPQFVQYQPNPQMFIDRYTYFDKNYDWI